MNKVLMLGDMVDYIRLLDTSDYDDVILVNGLCYGKFKDYPDEFNLKLVDGLTSVYYESFGSKPQYRDEKVQDPTIAIIGEYEYCLRIRELISHVINIVAKSVYILEKRNLRGYDGSTYTKLSVIVRGLYILRVRTWSLHGDAYGVEGINIKEVLKEDYRKIVTEGIDGYKKDNESLEAKVANAWRIVHTPHEYVRGF